MPLAHCVSETLLAAFNPPPLRKNAPDDPPKQWNSILRHHQARSRRGAMNASTGRILRTRNESVLRKCEVVLVIVIRLQITVFSDSGEPSVTNLDDVMRVSNA